MKIYSKQISLRVNPAVEQMLPKIDRKPGTAATTLLEFAFYLYQNTMVEINGMFSAKEIKALAEVYQLVGPEWQAMCNTESIVRLCTNAEKLNKTISACGTSFAQLIEKLEKLNACQAAVLQFELICYWNHDRNPDINQLYQILL